jgi:adenylate cyclase
MNMQRPMATFSLVAALLTLAVGVRIIDPEPIARLRFSIFDSYQRLMPSAVKFSHQVAIVAIDTASLNRIGQWPWPRTRLALIIERLRQAGARVIALDLILAEPDRLSPKEFARLFEGRPEFARLAEEAVNLPSNDEQLAAAIGTTPVVLGFVAETGAGSALAPPKAGLAFAGDDPQLFVPAFSGATSCLPMLGQRAAGIGSVNWLPSNDQIVRRVPLIVSVGGKIYPSLPLEAARVGMGESTLFVRSSGGSGMLAFGQQTGVESIRVGPIVLPTDANGEMWLGFSKHDATQDIPAYRILEGTFERGDVKDRYILIGASAPGLLDLRATPLQNAVPGVVVHAQALEQILSGARVHRPVYATGGELSFLVIFGALVAFLMQRRGPVLAALTAAAAMALVSALSWVAFWRHGLLLDPVYPSLALVALYLTISLGTYVKSEIDRNYVRSAFSHYLAPPLVEELARNHASLKLGGEMREVTVMFADVRGFSNIAEGLDAESLIHFVNEIFTPLSDVILARRGTIDKFIGDAVMAFWNAPLADSSHARHACQAALDMLATLDKLNGARAAEAAAWGGTATPIRIGIGLNTGDCCVGNVGSPQRFDYSILGDTVNIASRLQDETKIYELPIIAGEHTVAAAPEFAFLEFDCITLRGMGRQRRVFALLGDARTARTEKFRTLQAAMAALIRALNSQDTATARARLEDCEALQWPDLAGLLATYRARMS